MANRRYIDFPIATTVGDSDIILIWQSGANKQTTKATFLSGLPENLDELNDVAISGLTNGQILRYDSVTGKWENTDQGNLDLNDLNDVSIVSPSNGQVLVYNSSTSKWENSSGGYVPYTGAVTTVNLGAQTIQAGSFVKAGGTAAQFLKADGSVDSNTYGTGTVTSVALTMPSAFSVANSPITTAGTLAVTGAGTVGQYIRGDGSLADFPESSGGGSSVSYYLNGSVAKGTIGGVAYKELNKVPVLGAGTDFSIAADGYIASFITDAGDPNLLEIPGGNWNFETYFSASSSGGTPTFYVELYKVNSGGTATLIASNSGFPELIAFGTNIISYFSTLAVPTTALALTDRLAIRYYVTHSGRTITLHTEDNHLCQIVTTFTTGITALNGLTAQVQNFAVGTSGTDFAISSATATHTFNLPTASATNRGALSSGDWTTFNNKTSNLGTVTSVGLSSATSGVTIGSTPVTTSGTITLAIATASGSQNGLLSSTDWTTFNNKASTAQLANYLPLAGGTLTGALFGTTASFSGIITTTSTSLASGNFGGNAASWEGNINYPTLFGSSADRWIMHINPHISYTQNGVNGFTGSMTGATLRFASNPAAASYWDIGVGTNSAGTDKLSIGRAGTNYLSVTSTGNVGIGTLTAGQKLQIGSGSESGNHYLRIFGAASDIYFGQTGSNLFGAGNGQVLVTDSTYTGPLAIGTLSGNVNATLIFGTSNIEGMRIFSSRNVHIGPTPASDNGARLQVSGAATISGNGLFGGATAFAGLAGGIALNGSTNSGINFRIADVLRGYVYVAGNLGMYVESTAGNVVLAPTGNAALTATTSGNVGIGVIPSAWGSGPALQVLGLGLSTRTSLTSLAQFSSNQYWDGSTHRYINSNFSSIYTQHLGNHYFDVAASGTAGASISYTNVMSMQNNGNVLIGTTTDAGGRLQVNGTGKFFGTSVPLRTESTANNETQMYRTNTANGAGIGLYTNSTHNWLVGTAWGENSSNFIIYNAATGTQSFKIDYSTNATIFSSTVTSTRFYNPSGPYGTGAANARNHFTQFNAGNAGLAGGWIAGAFGDALGNRIVIGQYEGVAVIAGHSANLDAWASMSLATGGGNVIIGSTSDNGSKLQVNGAIRTAQPVGTTSNGWLLGRALVSGTSTPNRWIRVQIGLEYYDILAVYMGTL